MKIAAVSGPDLGRCFGFSGNVLVGITETGLINEEELDEIKAVEAAEDETREKTDDSLLPDGLFWNNPAIPKACRSSEANRSVCPSNNTA